MLTVGTTHVEDITSHATQIYGCIDSFQVYTLNYIEAIDLCHSAPTAGGHMYICTNTTIDVTLFNFN